MSEQPANTKPSDTFHEAGEVIMEGPDGVAFSMTPGCARQTGEKLRFAASEADREVRAGGA